MTDTYLLVQGIYCGIIVLFGCLLVMRYEYTIARRVRMAAYQYKLFALRDKVIWLVADEKASEEDPDWKSLYRHVNETAKAAGVLRIEYGLGLALHCLKTFSPPTPEDRKRFAKLPEERQELWVELVVTGVLICWKSSFWFRMAGDRH